MAKRIYVGNLPFSATDDEVRARFGRFGKVLRVDMQRGAATVDMTDEASAGRAIKALNRAEMGGKLLNVSEARPR